jgi:hypothetical protein
MDKAERLELLRKIGEQHREREELIFAGGLPVSKRDVQETLHDMDSFREEERARRSESEVINSDEA